MAPAELAELSRGYPESQGLGSGQWGSLQPGALVGGAYRVVGLLGEGGMGAVYRVVELDTERELALKLLGCELEGEAVERFRREAEAAARLGKRAGFVQIHSSGTHQGLPYYVMEIVEGSDLEARIDDLSADELARLLAAAARSLGVFHESGLVHRDLKPANLLIDSEGNPRVVDLGLVSDVQSAGLTATGELLGTPAYMAPEQVTDARSVDARSDVYALGAILYRGLAGQPPFLGSLVGILSAVVSATSPDKPSLIRAGVPSGLEAICLRAMAKAPEARYPSALELALDLERYLAGGELAAQPVATRGVRVAMILLVVAALLGGGVAFATLAGGPSPAPSPRSFSRAAPSASPTPDQAELEAEVRRFVRLGDFKEAKKRSLELSKVTPDLGWEIAVGEFPLLYVQVRGRYTTALGALAKEGEAQAADKVQAVQGSYAKCHACLEGLEGSYEAEARAELAKELERKSREIVAEYARKTLDTWEAEQLANLLRLQRSLQPERVYSYKELMSLVPSIPFAAREDFGPALRLAEALVALAPESASLHYLVGRWASQDPNTEVQRRLLPIVDRGLKLVSDPEKKLELRVLRMSCLLNGGVQWESLLREAGAMLEEDLSPQRRARVLELRGSVLLRQRVLARAEADFTASLSLVENSLVRSMRSQVRRDLGQRKGAIQDAIRLLRGERQYSADRHGRLVSVLWDFDRENPDLEHYVARLSEHQPTQIGWRLRLALLHFDSPEQVKVDLAKSLSGLGGFWLEGKEDVVARVKAMRSKIQRASGLLENKPEEARRVLTELVDELDRLRGKTAWP